MVRFLFIAIVMLVSQLTYANDISSFFDRLQGNWELKQGEIINHDGRGNASHAKITKLISSVVKTSEHEWKFTEEYCVESDCVKTSYFYILENEADLYLITEEGRSELVTLQSNANNLKFILSNAGSYSVTDCNLIGDNEMTQEGFTMNSDFTQSEVKISLKKSEL
jgi:hypothetical protein